MEKRELPYTIGRNANWCSHWEKSMEACTPVFIAALYIIVKIWNQPKCQSTDEWIKKMWCVYTRTNRILFVTPITRLLHPWNSPGDNTGVGSHSYFQEIFLTQASNPVSCNAGRFVTIWATGEAPKESVQFSHTIVSDSLWPYGLQHARLPCPAPKKGGAGIQQLSCVLFILSIGLTILQWIFHVAYYTPDGYVSPLNRW